MDEKKAPERIILGSGYIHLGVFTKGQQIPEPQDFCTDANRYSYIKNGATLEYSNEIQEAKDDMGRVSKTVIISEDVTLKAGLMTLIGDTIEKLCDTARVSVSQDGRYRKTKIGGVGNRKGAKYVICFHHVDPEDGDIWVMIVGQNQAGFTLSFAPSDATVVDAEFKAMPNLDDEGTLVNYVEEIKDYQNQEPTPDPDQKPEPEKKTYSVEQNLTNVQSTFSGGTVNDGEQFSATLTADEGHTIQTPTVIMGGMDIGSTAWDASGGTVTIGEVTGDIIITAAATPDESE